jgi:hypothetical protein
MDDADYFGETRKMAADNPFAVGLIRMVTLGIAGGLPETRRTCPWRVTGIAVDHRGRNRRPNPTFR